VDLTGSKVFGNLRIEGLPQKAELRLDDVTLAFAPVVSATTRISQAASFRRLELLKTAFGDGSEARYRVIRNYLHDNRDREQEGIFYRYEKRAKRLGMPLREPSSWIPRSVSACYDWFADYGQSYERAIVWLVGVQLGFGFLYAAMSDRFAWGGTFDSQVAAFTIAQLVRPFEILSARSPAGWPYQGVYPGGGGWWTLATVTHSVLSLILVALILLALQWRFRRE
jgi:hypothetical protein